MTRRTPRPGYYVTSWEGKCIKRSAGPSKTAAKLTVRVAPCCGPQAASCARRGLLAGLSIQRHRAHSGQEYAVSDRTVFEETRTTARPRPNETYGKWRRRLASGPNLAARVLWSVRLFGRFGRAVGNALGTRPAGGILGVVAASGP